MRLNLRDLSHPLNPTIQRVQQNATQVMATARLRNIMISKERISPVALKVFQSTHHHDPYALQQL